MENEKLYARNDAVPLVVHESDMARLERSNKRSFVLSIILIGVLLLSWLGFFWYESQFETVTETTQEVWQDSGDGGINRFVGGDSYGETVRSYNDPDLQTAQGSEP